MKKVGEKNPAPLLAWAETYLHHPNPEIRREICHGIEASRQKASPGYSSASESVAVDEKSRVKNTLVHVLGQIAYKKGCLETVIHDLKTWDNQALVLKACLEIVDVHRRYPFAVKTADEARNIYSSKASPFKTIWGTASPSFCNTPIAAFLFIAYARWYSWSWQYFWIPLVIIISHINAYSHSYQSTYPKQKTQEDQNMADYTCKSYCDKDCPALCSALLRQ